MPFLKSIRRSSFVEKEKRKKKSNNSWKPPFERRPSRRSSLDCRAHDLRLSFTGRVFFLYGGKMKWKEEKKKRREEKSSFSGAHVVVARSKEDSPHQQQPQTR
jgi:hypothetical protein